MTAPNPIIVKARAENRGNFDSPRHEPHLTWEECVERYPLLIRALKWVLIGTASEAGCVIRDYRDGHNFSCEACSHSGPTPLNRIRSAWKVRRVVRTEAAGHREFHRYNDTIRNIGHRRLPAPPKEVKS